MSLALTKNGEINAVIIEIIPTNGNKNALTAPISTPTFTITIENSPRGAANVNAERSAFPRYCLKIKLPNILPPNFIPVATAIKAIAMKI